MTRTRISQTNPKSTALLLKFSFSNFSLNVVSNVLELEHLCTPGVWTGHQPKPTLSLVLLKLLPLHLFLALRASADELHIGVLHYVLQVKAAGRRSGIPAPCHGATQGGSHDLHEARFTDLVALRAAENLVSGDLVANWALKERL